MLALQTSDSAITQLGFSSVFGMHDTRCPMCVWFAPWAISATTTKITLR